MASHRWDPRAFRLGHAGLHPRVAVAEMGCCAPQSSRLCVEQQACVHSARSLSGPICAGPAQQIRKDVLVSRAGKYVRIGTGSAHVPEMSPLPSPAAPEC